MLTNKKQMDSKQTNKPVFYFRFFKDQIEKSFSKHILNPAPAINERELS